MPENQTFCIQTVSSPADFEVVVQLFRDYASTLGIDLSFQDFQQELASIPGKYAAPTGRLLLVRDGTRDAGGVPLGCVGLRPLGDCSGCCEMKRLYVTPQGRGRGVGKALVHAIMSAAQQIGYHEIRLDSLPSMTAAIKLYEKAGFIPIEPYCANPIVGAIFLSRSLG